MTNFERWQLYNRDCCSPQSFIDFGFYFMMGAALQRRVWVGPAQAALFPNQYTILCAPPGVGKGRVVLPVKEFLGFHKRSRAAQDMDEREIKSHLKAMSRENLDTTEKFFKAARDKGIVEDELIFPQAADTSSWQAIVLKLGMCIDGIEYKDSNGDWKRYLHSSLIFCLEEFESLFKKGLEDISGFLIKTYDCQPYDYELVSRKKATVKQTCINILAGTTPTYIQETFDKKILGDGFSSRAWFIYEERDRQDNMFYRELSAEQQVARIELLQHLKGLSRLYGQATYSKDAYGFLEDWWPKYKQKQLARANNSPTLDSYYSRKQIHIQKLAMAMHFAEFRGSWIIELATVKRAMERAENVEKNMHLALLFKSTNPLAEAGKKLIGYLKSSPKGYTKGEISLELWSLLKGADVDDLLESMITMGKIDSYKDGSGPASRTRYKLK